ncbi:MAG TPA: hypothetical protein VND45_06600 [Thermoanaerobaculia bacterium]|jgi:hypothetical protein|nr:hypothetical protein [Thermoanaerobaculia bacterium]
MTRNRRQRGEGQFGCLVGLVLLLIAGLIAYRLIPVKVRAAELRDTVIDESKSAGQHNDKQIKESILYKARQLELPLEPADVVVKRANSYIKVDVKYTVPVQFPGYVYNWHFEHHYENPVF